MKIFRNVSPMQAPSGSLDRIAGETGNARADAPHPAHPTGLPRAGIAGAPPPPASVRNLFVRVCRAIAPAQFTVAAPGNAEDSPLSTAGSDSNFFDATAFSELCQQRLRSVERWIARCTAEGTFGKAQADDMLTALTRLQARSTAPGSAEGNFRMLEKNLIRLLARNLPDSARLTPKGLRSQATRLYRGAVVDAANDTQWHTIRSRFEHEGTTYDSILQPASRIMLGSQCIFPVAYAGKGISSGSTTEIRHATNLYISTFAAGPTLFQGVRHGICSPYGLPEGSARRRDGAVSRAREVVLAALMVRLGPSGLHAALRSGGVIDLPLTSTSLVTPFNFRGSTEGTQIADQMQAWQTLAAQRPLMVELHDEHGILRTVPVNLRVAAFNMGVNEAALKLGLGSFRPGARASDAYNRHGLEVLVGKKFMADASPLLLGGMAGAYLDTMPMPANAVTVRALAREISDMFRTRAHRNDGGDPYKLAKRIVLLSNEIGAVPCWNCKSGKDRTGMLDCELKQALVTKDQSGHFATPDMPMSDRDRALLGTVMLHSGNLEIQKQNTGAAGNKVLKNYRQLRVNLSLHERINDPDVFRRAQGLSRLVKS